SSQEFQDLPDGAETTLTNIPTKNQMSKEMSGQCRMISTSETRHAPEQRRTTHRHSREPAQRSDALRPRN
ncbi:hypothetical protein, partial [Klebsiella pneumoniae]